MGHASAAARGHASSGWALLLAAACSAAACTSTPLAEARITAVLPGRAPEGVDTALVVSGEGFFPAVTTDFARPSASSLEAAVAVSLVSGDGTAFALAGTAYLDAQTVSAVAPAQLPRGLYDVRVRDGRGAEAVLPGGFSVVTPAESVARFEFQPLGPQVVAVPFPVVLLALDEAGTLVESFTGAVDLTDATGTVAPQQAGPFARGRLPLFASVGALTAADRLSAQDALGHRGQSDEFSVSAGPPTAAAFLSPPTVVTAGVCAGPFALQVLDAHGFATAVAADAAIALAAPPLGGVTFSADAACAAPLAAATMAAGTGRVDLWLTARLAGSLSLRAQLPGLPAAEAPLTVGPGPAVGLAFTVAPGTVGRGGCSPLLQLTSQDALGNPSPVPLSTPVALSATPATGVAFFSDAQCGTALGTVQLDAAAATLSLWLTSSVAGTLRLDADTVGGTMLSPASLSLEVTP